MSSAFIMKISQHAAGRRGLAGGGTREPVANGRGQAAAPALRNIEMPVMTIQGMNTMKPKKDTQRLNSFMHPVKRTPERAHKAKTEVHSPLGAAHGSCRVRG